VQYGELWVNGFMEWKLIIASGTKTRIRQDSPAREIRFALPPVFHNVGEIDKRHSVNQSIRLTCNPVRLECPSGY
jgi:hypothetical protein